VSNDPLMRILVLEERATPSSELLDAIRTRADRGPAQFRVVVPNPAAAEVHLLHPERHDKAAEAERILRGCHPRLRGCCRRRWSSAPLSVRHDPMDAGRGRPVQRAHRRNHPVGHHAHDRALACTRISRLDWRHYGLPITTVGWRGSGMSTTTGTGTGAGASVAATMLNKVPEVTVYFWIIKILCTTVGESFADYINETPRFRPDEHHAVLLSRH